MNGEATRRLTGVRVPGMAAEGTEGEAGAAAAEAEPEAEAEAPAPPLIRCVGGPARGGSPPPPPVLSISMLDELIDLIDPGRLLPPRCLAFRPLCLLWSRPL